MNCYKARTVIKRYSQRKRVDYDETYSPVARHSSLRYLFALAVEPEAEWMENVSYQEVVGCLMKLTASASGYSLRREPSKSFQQLSWAQALGSRETPSPLPERNHKNVVGVFCHWQLEARWLFRWNRSRRPVSMIDGQWMGTYSWCKEKQYCGAVSVKLLYHSSSVRRSA